MKSHCFFRILFLLFALIQSGWVKPEEQNAQATQPAKKETITPAEKTKENIEQTPGSKPELKLKSGTELAQSQNQEENPREFIYKKAVNFANWIDKFFGSKEELESASYDYLRLINNLTFQQDESVKYRPRIKAKIHLPQLSNRTSLLFSTNRTDQNENFDSEENENDTLADEKDEKLSAALNYEASAFADSKFDFRVGLDSSFDTFAFIKHSIPLLENETLEIRNFNYLFWEEKYGFGVATQLELNHVIDDSNLFRWKYSIRRAEKSFGNEWNNRFSLINQLSADNWMAYELRVKGDTAHAYNVESYRLSVRFRKKTSVDWLYFEIEPEIRYDRTPESIDRELIPGVTFRLEVQFES